jgi:RimJ/RimL family protein N-acetyltransferase
MRCLISLILMIVFTVSFASDSTIDAGVYLEGEIDDGIYYAKYPHNTLPELSFETSKAKVKLKKVSTSDCTFLAILDSQLLRNGQCHPALDREHYYSLFKGNEDKNSERGWIIYKCQGVDETAVGLICYFLLEGVWEMECYIHPDHQKQGFATAALQAVLGYIKLENEKVDRILAIIAINNEASRSLAERNGFYFKCPYKKFLFYERKVESKQ